MAPNRHDLRHPGDFAVGHRVLHPRVLRPLEPIGGWGGARGGEG